jgi:hypothetical protein
MSEAQTPMNDSFLANLAPSVHQRLDLARQMGEVARAATPVEEEPGMDADPENASPSDDSWQQIDRTVNTQGSSKVRLRLYFETKPPI